MIEAEKTQSSTELELTVGVSLSVLLVLVEYLLVSVFPVEFVKINRMVKVIFGKWEKASGVV